MTNSNPECLLLDLLRLNVSTVGVTNVWLCRMSHQNTEGMWYCWIHELLRIRWKDSECNNTFRIWQVMLKAYDVLWCLGVGLGFSILWADSQLMLACVCVWSQHCWRSISSTTLNGTRTSPLLSTMLSAGSATSHPYWELSLLTPGSGNTSESLSCKCTKVWIQANNKNTLCKLCSFYVHTF